MSYPYRLWLLFFAFFKIALIVIGGGLAMLTAIEETFSKKYAFLKHEDILDMVILTQTVPGLIAVNAALFVGNKVAGFAGALIAVFGVILPALVIITVIASFFPNLDFQKETVIHAFSAVRACVTGVLIATALSFIRTNIRTKWDIVFVVIFTILLLVRISPIIVILTSVPIGCILVNRSKKKPLTVFTSPKTTCLTGRNNHD